MGGAPGASLKRTAWEGEVLSAKLQRGLQVDAHDGGVQHLHVHAGSVKVKGAPGRGVGLVGVLRKVGAVMAVFNPRGGRQERGPKGNVLLSTARVQLDVVKAKAPERRHVPQEVREIAARVGTDAIILVPTSSQVACVHVVDHCLKVWELDHVDDRVAVLVVKTNAAWPAVLCLPRVVQTQVSVSEVRQAGGHAIHGARPAGQRVCDLLQQVLRNLRSEEVPGAPTPRRRNCLAIVQAKGRQQQGQGQQERRNCTHLSTLLAG